MADENDALTFGRSGYLPHRAVAAPAAPTTQPRRRRRSPALGVVLGVLIGILLWALVLTPVVLLLRS